MTEHRSVALVTVGEVAYMVYIVITLSHIYLEQYIRPTHRETYVVRTARMRSSSYVLDTGSSKLRDDVR